MLNVLPGAGKLKLYTALALVKQAWGRSVAQSFKKN